MSKVPCALVTLAFAASLYGCEGADLTGDPRLPADLDPALSSSEGAAAIAGGGILDLPGLPITFHFDVAQTGEDDVAEGRFRYYVTFEGELVDFSGEATCMTVDADNRRAWVGGVILTNNSTHPFWMQDINDVGRDIWFRIQDAGDGRTSVDRSTFVGFEGNRGIITSQEYCDAMLWPADDEGTIPLMRGSIVLRQ